VIVVNDASTDETAALARAAGARTLDVQLRKISAVRNSGAREAKGDVFFFLDADTRISEATLRAALRALEDGAVGGGAFVTFAEPVSLSARIGIDLFSFLYMRLVGWAAGCFIFATRAAFEAAGGFDERLFAAEEIALSIALKRQGRFVLLRESVTTSARKLRLHSPLDVIPFVGRFLVRGFGMLRRRDGLDWWYDGKREK
jgi:glycosyltransferase involved in cell wall biosynthesis